MDPKSLKNPKPNKHTDSYTKTRHNQICDNEKILKICQREVKIFFFKKKARLRNFLNKWQLKELFASRPTLKWMLKEFFQVEENWYQIKRVCIRINKGCQKL